MKSSRLFFTGLCVLIMFGGHSAFAQSCGQCEYWLPIDGGVCYPKSEGTTCSGCASIDCNHSGCGGCSLEDAGRCECDGKGSCRRVGWFCQEYCPDPPPAQTCTSTCGACSNSITCYPDGGSTPGPGPDPDPGCICSCNSAGLTAPAQVSQLIKPSNSATKVGGSTTFVWNTISSWGTNIKTCTSGNPGVHCPSGNPGDGGIHRYQIVVSRNSDLSSPIYSEFVEGNEWYYNEKNPAFASCTYYYWAVRAVNRNPVSGHCYEADSYGEFSPVRSFRTNCNPLVISISPSASISGRYAFGSTGFPDTYELSCSRNNPVQFTMVLEDPDGANDIALGGIYIVSNSVTNPGPATHSNSVHAVVTEGAMITVTANGTPAGGVYPQMGLFIDNELVYVWKDVGRNGRDIYRYDTRLPVHPSQVSIGFLNDIVIGDQDRNLTEVELYINGEHQASRTVDPPNGGNASTGILWGRGPGTVTRFVYHGNMYQVYGSNGFVGYGLRYVSSINTNSGSNTGVHSWKNYSWGIPTNGALNQYVTTMEQIGSEDLWNTDRDISSYKGHVRVVAVNDINSTQKRVVFEVIFGGDDSSKIGSELKVFGTVKDYSNGGGGWIQRATHMLDFTPPAGNIESTVTSQDEISLTWSSSDPGGAGVAGTAISGAFTPKNSSYNGATGTFSSSNGDVQNSGLLGMNTSQQIWRGNNIPTSSGQTDISLVSDAGSFNYSLHAVDNVCNVSTILDASPTQLGASWYITKGGLAYSRGGYYSDIPTLDGSESIHDTFVPPFVINKDEVNISTELLASGNQFYSVVKSSNASPPFVLGDFSSRAADRSEHMFELMRADALGKVRLQSDDFYYTDIPGNIEDDISGYCGDDESKLCVLDASNNIEVNNDLHCNRPTAILVGGNLSISSNITVGNETDRLDGCIFIVKGNIDIYPTSQPSSDVQYDVIHSYLRSGGQITIHGDSADYPKGLKINGSLIGLATENRGIRMNRTLQLRQNLEYPSLAVHYDPRYYILAQKFFGRTDVYRKDSGYKSY